MVNNDDNNDEPEQKLISIGGNLFLSWKDFSH